MSSVNSALRYVPQTPNAILSVVALLFQVSAVFATPAIWRSSGWAFAAYLLAYCYITVLCWLLIHEGIHYKLLGNRKFNDLVARAHSITFGCPFHILKVGHMTHHRYNRGELDSNEWIPSDTKVFPVWWLAYYARILCLMYVSEVVSPLVFFFWTRAKRFIVACTKNRSLPGILNLFTHRMVKAIQMDAVLSVAFIAAQFYANRYDLRPLVILLLARAFIISFYDNAYHYGTDAYDLQAANNLSVPEFLRPIILNHNLHRIHHRYPTASWAVLRELEQRDGEQFDATLASTIWQQLKGPMRRPDRGASADLPASLAAAE